MGAQSNPLGYINRNRSDERLCRESRPGYGAGGPMLNMLRLSRVMGYGRSPSKEGYKMNIPQLFKNPLFYCCIGVYLVCILILRFGGGIIAVGVVNAILEINSFAIGYLVYMIYIKKK